MTQVTTAALAQVISNEDGVVMDAFGVYIDQSELELWAKYGPLEVTLPGTNSQRWELVEHGKFALLH